MKTERVVKYEIDLKKYKKIRCWFNITIVTFLVKDVVNNCIYYAKFSFNKKGQFLGKKKPILKISWRNQYNEPIQLNINYNNNSDSVCIYDFILNKINLRLNDFYVLET